MRLLWRMRWDRQLSSAEASDDASDDLHYNDCGWNDLHYNDCGLYSDGKPCKSGRNPQNAATIGCAEEALKTRI